MRNAARKELLKDQLMNRIIADQSTGPIKKAAKIAEAYELWKEIKRTGKTFKCSE